MIDLRSIGRCFEIVLFAIVTALVVPAPVSHASAGNSLTIERVVDTGVDRAVYASYSPDPLDANKLFTVHQDGEIRIIDLNTNTVLPTPFITVPGNSGNESGLIGLTFHPNYATNGRFFINRHDGDQLRIEEYQRGANSNVADPNMVRPIWTHTQHTGSHNGGWIGFNPLESAEGKYYLWRTTGDGGGPDGGATPGSGEANNSAQHDPHNRAQTLEEPHGKVIRIDIGDDLPVDAFADVNNNYSIPPDNPFVLGPSNGVPHVQGQEVYALGLRHPWRAGFDRETGDFYIGETSQDVTEEINLIPYGDNSGLNFGWRLRDGLVATRTEWLDPDGNPIGGPEPPNNTVPIYLYWHDDLPNYVEDPGVPNDLRGDSVTGGSVYRGPIEALDGYYFFGDYSQGKLWSFTFDGSDPAFFDGDNTLDFINWISDDNTLTLTNGASSLSGLAGFGEDQAGNVYLVRHNGEILRIADATIFGPPSIYGDTDLDGDVDEFDLNNFLAGWGQTAPVGTESWMLGDFNLNGITDLPDVYYMHQGLVNAGLGSLSPFENVPEPSAWLSLWIGASVLLGRPGKRHQVARLGISNLPKKRKPIPNTWIVPSSTTPMLKRRAAGIGELCGFVSCWWRTRMRALTRGQQATFKAATFPWVVLLMVARVESCLYHIHNTHVRRE